MITLHPLHNDQEVLEIVTKDDLYKTVLYRDKLDLTLPEYRLYGWFAIKEKDKTIGIFVLQYFIGNNYLWHGGIYPEYRHKNSKSLLIQCFNHFKEDINWFTLIPETNKQAIRFIEKMNFTYKTKVNNYLMFGEI